MASIATRSAGEPPVVTRPLDSACAPQKHLRGADSVLPLLAEMLTVNNPVDRVITEVWVNRADTPMKIDGTHWATTQQVENGIGEDCMCGSPCCAGAEYLHIGSYTATFEFLAKPSTCGSLKRPADVTKIICYSCERFQLDLIYGGTKL
jgi:hypothetical protein